MYALDDYDYHLPETLIAQTPVPQRDGSRLLRLSKRDGRIEHWRFHGIVDLLQPSDVLVVNDTRVVPARLHGRKASGGKAELLILDYREPTTTGQSDNHRRYRCLIKASKQCTPGTRIHLAEGLVAEVQEFADGVYSVAFSSATPFDALLQRIGRMPLPPYIKREITGPEDVDRMRYQTVYARHQGAIAAPTAGLHFTDTILSRIRAKGVIVAPVTLHVGYGTFVPVRVDDIREHRMHEEWFSVSTETARQVNQAKVDGRRVIAVGTTSVRTLEYAARDTGRVVAGTGRCDLFIFPGYTFRVIDAMITNFHLPRSTLLMLVSAFAGRDAIQRAYAEAVRENYRFFSYGDAMLME